MMSEVDVLTPIMALFASVIFAVLSCAVGHSSDPDLRFPIAVLRFVAVCALLVGVVMGGNNLLRYLSHNNPSIACNVKAL